MNRNVLKDCVVGDLGKIITGKTPSTKEDLFWGDEVMFLTPKDMKLDKNIYDTERKLTNLGAESVKNHILPANTICVSCIGSDMGKVVKLKKDSVTNQQINSIVVNDENNCDYVYYLMWNISNEIKTLGKTSTAIPLVNKNTFSSMKIKIHKIEEQQKIADLLSSLDNKIELNNQINKDLEELAQTLYTKWFVNFDFPNEEGKPYKSNGGEMIDSELGEIPLGWSIGTLDDGKISNIINSGVDNYDGVKKYLATADVNYFNINTSVNETDYISRKSRANMQPIENSIWFAKMKDTEKYILVSDFSKDLINDYIFSTGFAGVKCDEYSLYYLWRLINTKSFIDKKNSLAYGSTQKAINNESINKIKIIIPNRKILFNYNEMIKKTYYKIYLNNLENQQLKETRDLLLPYLMSGKIKLD